MAMTSNTTHFLSFILLLSIVTSVASFTTSPHLNSRATAIYSTTEEVFTEGYQAGDEDDEDYEYFSDNNIKGYVHMPEGDDPLKIYAPKEEEEEEYDDNYEEYGFDPNEVDFMREYEAYERQGKKMAAADIYKYFLLYQELIKRSSKNKPQVWNLDAFTKKKSWPPRQEDGNEEVKLKVFVENEDVDTYLEEGSKYPLEACLKDSDEEEETVTPDDILSKNVRQIRTDLAIPETFLDEWYTLEEVERFRSYPDRQDPVKKKFEPKPFMNNRFTKEEDKVDFTGLDPYRARKLAVQLARSTNNEWLPEGFSEEKLDKEIEEIHKRGILAGTIRPGPIDADIEKRIQPAINIFNGCAQLLSIQDGVFRFHYHGMIRHKHGMRCYMEKCLKDCDVQVTGVIFETGRERDARDSPLGGAN